MPGVEVKLLLRAATADRTAGSITGNAIGTRVRPDSICWRGRASSWGYAGTVDPCIVLAGGTSGAAERLGCSSAALGERKGSDSKENDEKEA